MYFSTKNNYSFLQRVTIGLGFLLLLLSWNTVILYTFLECVGLKYFLLIEYSMKISYYLKIQWKLFNL